MIRTLLYHEQVFRELRSRTVPGLGADIAHQITDVYEQQERAGSLAGIYSMSVENMPELHSRSGCFILLAVMAGIVFFLLVLFRKKRWL